jgi:MFS family permease
MEETAPKFSLLDGALAVLLGWLTDDPRSRRNVFWITLASIFYGATMSLYGGEVWVGFLTKTGFSDPQFGLLQSVATLAGAAGLLLFMGMADRIQRRIRTYVICLLCIIVFPVVVTALAFVPREMMPLGRLLGLLIVLTVGQQLISSIWIMLDYPIWARALPVGIRGRMFAITSMAFCILGLLLGAVTGTIIKNVPYPNAYAYCFLAAAVAILLRAVSVSRIRELPEMAVPGESRSPLPFAAIWDVLRLKEFQWLGPPHILRGLVGGIMGFSLKKGLDYLQLPDQYAGYSASAFAAAGIAGGIVLGLVADRWGAAKTTLLADIVLAIGMGTLMLFGPSPVFLVLYFLMHLGRTVEDSSIPLGCINIVPPEHLGAFSAARLMVLTGFNAVGLMLGGFLFPAVGPVALFGITAAVKVLNGVWFWYVFRLKKPVDLAAQAEAEGLEAEPQAGHTEATGAQ